MINYNKIYKKVKDVICYTMNKEEVKNVLNQVYNHIENQDKEITQLREKLNKYNKDTEIQKLQNEIRKNKKQTLITLSNTEREKIENFKHKHYESCKGNIRFIIERASIGTCISIQCTKCGEIDDVTDYDLW